MLWPDFVRLIFHTKYAFVDIFNCQLRPARSDSFILLRLPSCFVLAYGTLEEVSCCKFSSTVLTKLHDLFMNKSSNFAVEPISWYFLIALQWRIKDFPEEGALTPKEGVPTYYLANFSRKLHENEEILGQRGRRASLAPPLRSATALAWVNIFFLRLLTVRDLV